MSDLIMTISDDESEPPQISSRKRAKPSPAEEQEADSSDEDGADDSSDEEEQADDSGSDDDEDDDDEDDDDDAEEEEEDAEDASFGGSFHFEASDDDSEDEVVHVSSQALRRLLVIRGSILTDCLWLQAWDLGEARAAAVQGGKGTNLRAKIDATLRRKGPSQDVVPGDEPAEAEEAAAQVRFFSLLFSFLSQFSSCAAHFSLKFR